MKQNTKRVAKAKILAAIVVGLLALASSGCSSDNGDTPPNAVAATVHGVPISEGQVTERIQTMRQLNQLEDAEKWRQMLESSGATPERYREQVIRDIAREIVIRRAAEAEGLQPNAETISAQIEQTKTGVGEEGNAWAERLRQYGFSSEDEYRSKLELQDLEAQLRTLKAPATTPSEDELRAYVVANAARYAGRRSSRIVFLRTETNADVDLVEYAWEARDKLLAGVELGVVAAEYTRATNEPTMNGDMGWDAINSSAAEYQAALAGLWPGQISEPVVTESGVTLIKCTEVYELSDAGEVVYEDVPESIRQLFSDQLAMQLQETSHRDYLNTLLEAAEITINAMPAGLPYSV
ncbi:MAG: SurA N-terminal domain-containing protein [Propionibacteriaceae bacterium]|nr:SurA N-terminal domain-containing protein [Propionibacteriaceae bacterium]